MTCRTCEQIHRMQHADLLVVQADQKGGVLQIEQARELQRSLAVAPYQSPYRVALLLRFEEANQNTANALLKTLEEPSSRAVLILTAESVESLPETVVSRCELLRLRPAPVEEVSRWLEAQKQVPLDLARRAAHLSGGCPGEAVRLSDPESKSLAQHQAWLDAHLKLVNASRAERFAYAEWITKDREKQRERLQTWVQALLSLWRDVLVQSSGSKIPLVNLDYADQIQGLARSLEVSSIHRMVAALLKTKENLLRNANPRLAVEVLLLDIPQVREILTSGETHATN